MRWFDVTSWRRTPVEFLAPAFIAVGLGVLLLGSWWSAAPVVTAVSIVALGATATTIHRRSSAAVRHASVAMHLFVYSNLYLLMVGAICHLELGRGGISYPAAIDLIASVLPMAIMVRRSISAMRERSDFSMG